MQRIPRQIQLTQPFVYPIEMGKTLPSNPIVPEVQTVELVHVPKRDIGDGDIIQIHCVQHQRLYLDIVSVLYHRLHQYIIQLQNPQVQTLPH